ncbi:4-hydroxy-tetrahydrodipicolinate reductase [Kangiella sediminilitoris]|uniref:4-hydroxy-tetrahydrodipicolinate reductase n=1 Tax=Kangiella sediminilitoris TaxID=1144748 RepID=A0A1B3B872_9GAMM|nr:4-hydroxy-tetrahydrodipicolinate reductase [Kangiella sediminilitoris]AOE48956.1 4-hydroxy-tetrahydrodipicolinate reductase [Kangiella sediminilitoris]
MSKTKVIINAATGRMGKELLKAAIDDRGAELISAIARAGHPLVGTDIAILTGSEPIGVVVDDDLHKALSKKGVVIDFSLPDYSIECLNQAVPAKSPMVIGTTGYSQEQLDQIEKASKYIPIVLAANYSVGVNSLIGLVKQATRLLGDKADVEIFEAHHKHKKDAPSGTALALGEAVAKERGVNLSDVAEWTRYGEAPRQKGDIGFSVMRAGDIVGTHDVVFALNGEMVTIRHEAQSRQCFASGAVTAAHWVKSQKPGLYDMQDVLGL